MIKLSSFRSSLHSYDEFDKGTKKFINDIESKIDDKLNISKLDDYDCDLKLIFIESGGSEGLFLKAFDKLKEPYYFLTSGNNNSLAASLEILTFLNLNNKKGEIIHGSIDYISNRIKELEKLSIIKNNISNTKLGVIGKPSDWLISSVPNYLDVKNKFGIDLINISLDEVKEEFEKFSFDDLKISLKEFDKEELAKAKRIYKAFDNICKKYELDGFSVRCFDLLTPLKSTGCLGLALLNDNNIISSCEGDIMAMISMLIAKTISNNDVFQANPSRIDIENKKIVFAHCTIPLNMVKDYKFDTHFESRTGVAIKGYLYEDDVTVLRLSSNLCDYFIEEGKIIRNLDDPNLCRTQIEVLFDNDISNILKKPCGNHHIIFYGRHKKEILDYLKNI